MDEQLPYLVAFSHVKGIGAVRLGNLQRAFGSLDSAWNASADQFRESGFPERVIQSILDYRGQTDPDELIAQITARGISILSLADESYPTLLKQIDNPPALLYYVGHLPAQPMRAIAVVGTRRMTSYGQSLARELSAYLASNGVIVVSGLARGIDGEAHQAVLNVDGITLAVLGSGVDTIYPPEHRNLAKAIIRKGAILSEFAPGTKPDRMNFPQRNRIISGMSAACLIIEAGEKSGSLITARFAAEQGREVFVLPGNYHAPQSRGANRLIHDGARPLYEKAELLEYLQSWQGTNPTPLNKPMQMSFENKEEKQIIDLITLEPLHLDEIVRLSGIPVSQVSATMLMLELKGFVNETAPQTWQKTQELY